MKPNKVLCHMFLLSCLVFTVQCTKHIRRLRLSEQPIEMCRLCNSCPVDEPKTKDCAIFERSSEKFDGLHSHSPLLTMVRVGRGREDTCCTSMFRALRYKDQTGMFRIGHVIDL